MDPPEDLRDPDGICDWLDDRKVIDRERLILKEMLDSAHWLDAGARRGEERDG